MYGILGSEQISKSDCEGEFTDLILLDLCGSDHLSL